MWIFKKLVRSQVLEVRSRRVTGKFIGLLEETFAWADSHPGGRILGE